MTIDEAIQHCKEVAKENRKTALEYARAYAWDTAHGCRECANEHEKLASWLVELKERRERTRWIPCSERMPEKRVFVLCFCLAGILDVVYWGGTEWKSSGNRAYTSEFVTHWMPMPEPPEGGEENACH